MQSLLLDFTLIKRFIFAVVVVAIVSLAFSGLAKAAGFWAARVEGDRAIVYSQNFKQSKQILAQVEQNLPNLERKLNYYDKNKIRVFVYNEASNFRTLAGSSEAVGEAEPFANQIDILANQPNLAMIIRHELAHILLIRSAHSPTAIPFWFNEGLAIYLSDPGYRTADYENLALKSGLPSMQDLVVDSNQTATNSAQAYLMVQFIANRWGEDKLLNIVNRIHKGENFSLAVRNELGVSLESLNHLWKRYGAKKVRASWFLTLRQIGWLAIGLAALLVPLAWLKKRKELAKDEPEDFIP